MLLALRLITPTRNNIFLTSWCQMKGVTCGYMAMVKKYGFSLGMSWLEDDFHLKICQKCINLRFKAPKLFYITPMRQNGTNKKDFLKKDLFFY